VENLDNCYHAERMAALENSIDEWPGIQRCGEFREMNQGWKEDIPDMYARSHPLYFQTFSDHQIRKLAIASGFIVKCCEYAPGIRSGYPPWVLCAREDVEIPARFLNKEMVVLVATKPSE